MLYQLRDFVVFLELTVALTLIPKQDNLLNVIIELKAGALLMIGAVCCQSDSFTSAAATLLLWGVRFYNAIGLDDILVATELGLQGEVFSFQLI
jgi:hypothetical protein